MERQQRSPVCCFRRFVFSEDHNICHIRESIPPPLPYDTVGYVRCGNSQKMFCLAHTKKRKTVQIDRKIKLSMYYLFFIHMILLRDLVMYFAYNSVHFPLTIFKTTGHIYRYVPCRSTVPVHTIPGTVVPVLMYVWVKQRRNVVPVWYVPYRYCT